MNSDHLTNKENTRIQRKRKAIIAIASLFAISCVAIPIAYLTSVGKSSTKGEGNSAISSSGSGSTDGSLASPNQSPSSPTSESLLPFDPEARIFGHFEGM